MVTNFQWELVNGNLPGSNPVFENVKSTPAVRNKRVMLVPFFKPQA